MEQGHEKGSAFAICTDAFNKAGKPIYIGESERQKLHLFCESFKLEGNKVSGVAIHPMRIFHPEENMTHVYLREELERASPTLAGKPFGIDHIYILPPPNLITKAWYCEDKRGVCFEGTVDDHIAQQIREKAFKGISIELNWLRPGGSVSYVNGVAARNFELTSLHLLKQFPPGDPEAFVKLWEQMKEQLVVAPPLPLDQRVNALEQQLQEIVNQIQVINGKLDVLAGQPSPSATAKPAEPGASQTIGVMKMSEQNQEPSKCPEGQVRDPETEECVPKKPEEQATEGSLKEEQGEETDEQKQFMAQCLESGKTMEQCVAEWKQKQEGGETHGAQAEGIVALRKKLVEVEAALTKMEKQQKRETSSWRERYERLFEAVKGAIPPPRIWKSWTPGPQRYVQENLKILRETVS